MIFFTSDLHIGHSNILKYSGRPFSSLDEMNTALIKNWNQKVSPRDDIYILGDFYLGHTSQAKQVIESLNGRKYLIAGNHDKRLLKVADLRSLFTWIGPYLELNYNNSKYVLSHYSHRVWNKSHYGSYHLFGHSHGSLPPHGKSVDVGVDAPWITGEATYTPYSIEEVTNYLDSRNIAFVDHHKERKID